MAKKAVASFKADKASAKSYTKCIKLVKSEKTGAYAFKEEVVHNNEVKDFFAEK
ncbi:MAG: DUF4295 domain-containing protein [Prevotellaceae bacterium]|jgi:hypothetical protein|nr:DUF4295 domain-containing protein [Prevotellaceae bacterium]